MSHFIIDCDPGHDDAVAMMVAAKYLDLVGITTVFGNSSVENTTRNALAILNAAGLSHIPVAAGAAGPLTGTTHSGESVHGKTGLDGANFAPSGTGPLPQPAAEFIAEQAERHGDLVIVAIAPETNLANALTEFPSIRSKIAEISIMGGSTNFGNATAAAEFNIFADPEAAAIVFESGIPITMAGLNVTTGFGVTTHDIDRLQRHGGSIAGELGSALGYYLSKQSAMYERDYAPVHDVCAVLPFTHPGLIHHESMHVAVECDGRYTRGMTVCDLRGKIAGDGIEPMAIPNANVAMQADGDAIIRLLIDTLCEFP